MADLDSLLAKYRDLELLEAKLRIEQQRLVDEKRRVSAEVFVQYGRGPFRDDSGTGVAISLKNGEPELEPVASALRV